MCSQHNHDADYAEYSDRFLVGMWYLNLLKCWSILSNDTLNRHLDQNSIDIPVNTQSALYWHLVNSWSIVICMLTYYTHVNWPKLVDCWLRCRLSVNPGGGTLGMSGWGCAAGTLEPLAYTRASSAEFCYPLLELTPQITEVTSTV